MRTQIRRLEAISRQLEPSRRKRTSVRNRVVSYTEKFLDSIEDAKTYNLTAEKGKGLLKSGISEDPESIEAVLALIRDHVDYPGLNPASGGHLGYIPGGGIYYSALGDYLADVTNRFAGIFFASPGAVRMENLLVRWLASILGFPSNSAGNLTSGGSIANLIAIVTARDAMKIRPVDTERAVIYLTEQVHHSVNKAIRIAGLAETIIQSVPMDRQFRMIPRELQRQIAEDRKANRIPFLIIASAGTTDVGAIDPLDKIGRIAKKEKIWYHVDAAYGGFFVLTKEGARKLRGIQIADSIVIDPHKGMFLPYGLGVVLVKNRSSMQASHYYRANYMQDAVLSEEEPSPADLSPELTKHFRGMRFWLPLKLHGLKPFRACLEEKRLLAKYFYREIRKLGFETGPEPQLSVVTYRYVPRGKNPDEFNKRLLDEIVADGRVFISSTMLNGLFTLRFACLAFRTHLSTVDLLLKLLNEKKNKLLKE